MTTLVQQKSYSPLSKAESVIDRRLACKKAVEADLLEGFCLDKSVNVLFAVSSTEPGLKHIPITGLDENASTILQHSFFFFFGTSRFSPQADRLPFVHFRSREAWEENRTKSLQLLIGIINNNI